MMSPDQRKLVEEVYRLFIKGEESAGWDDLDDQLCHLDNLDDDQIVRESEALMITQKKGTISCHQEFCNNGCHAEDVVEASEAIIELYKSTGNLHKNNRYVLSHYLGLSQLRFIISK